MKLNKKGFMLAEVVVVAAVISTALVTMYIGLNRLTQAYETRNRYYDIDAMQIAMEVNDMIKKNNFLNTISEECPTSNNLLNCSDDLSDYYNDYFYINYIGDNKSGFSKYNDINIYYSSFDRSNIENTKSNINSLKSLDVTNTTNTFKDYVDYLSNNIDFSGNYNYLIIVELQKKDVDNSYYYTLKVGDNNA